MPKFKPGERVEAWLTSEGWLPARVKSAINSSIPYLVVFDDGLERWLPEGDVRPPIGSSPNAPTSEPEPAADGANLEIETAPDDPPIVQALRDRMRDLRAEADGIERMLRRHGYVD